MSENGKVTVAGVFPSPSEADRAVEALTAAGFQPYEIGVLSSQDEGCRSEGEITYQTGAAVGGMVGASVGGLAGGPPGLLAGAVAGGLLGALIDIGIPEDSASFYCDEQQAGRTVVIIRSDRADAAEAVLGELGAKDIRRSWDAG